MKVCAGWTQGLLLIAFVVAVTLSWAAVPNDTEAVAKIIKAEVAQLVAGLNAHDAARTTSFDAPDVISMECGSGPTIGIEEDRKGFQMGFVHDPLWKVRLIDEIVDVSSGGDMAIYRGTYHEDNGVGGVLMTHKTNFIAEFKRQGDGSWKIAWYIVSNMEKSHAKEPSKGAGR